MMDNSSTGNSGILSSKLFIISGIVLLLCFGLIAYISPEFSRSIPLIERPVLLLVGILVFAGAIFLLTAYKIPRVKLSKNQLLWIIAVGVLLRLLMLFTAPILEDDYFRYLWDGAVTAKGINPYKYSPEQVIEGVDVPEELVVLADESGDIIHGINYPHLRTIYPPVAQAFFAISNLLGPWNLFTWKIILLIIDLATLSLIFVALGILRLPSSYILIYWWNPLVLKEIFNSGHLDVLVFPFVLSALISATQNRYVRSTLTLIVGIGIKLWPAFLLPVIWRHIISKPKQLITAIVLSAISLGLLFLPIYYAGLDGSSGFIAYGQTWQNNDSIFRIIVYISEFFLNIFGYETFHKYSLSRYIVLALIALWILFVTFGRTFRNNDLFSKSLYIVAFAFLVSPTQFPWYYTWLIPFLAIKPRFSLLVLTALLPFYYLRYYFEPRGQLELFTNVIIWIEFVPVWILLLWEWRNSKRASLPESSE